MRRAPLRDQLGVLTQPGEALASVAHQIGHTARVEDQRPHHLLQLNEELWEGRQHERYEGTIARERERERERENRKREREGGRGRQTERERNGQVSERTERDRERKTDRKREKRVSERENRAREREALLPFCALASCSAWSHTSVAYRKLEVTCT